MGYISRALNHLVLLPRHFLQRVPLCYSHHCFLLDDSKVQKTVSPAMGFAITETYVHTHSLALNPGQGTQSP